MTIDIREEGRRALEEEFFARLNFELKEKLLAEMSRREAIIELSRASGIANEKVLEILLDAQITPGTLQALSLVPLVRVAWADGVLEPAEQEAILKAAAAQGIDPNHAGYDALKSWLTEAPSDTLFNTWQNYVRELGMTMSKDAFAKVRVEILGRAETVAKAAGGFLGLGSKISAVEREELEKIDEAFEIFH
ncbi:MAG: hypothetical protein H7249_06105 [Chitinophagaceae bacterium]|nr:hypothetical protein [Oligoflexus sp.]